MPILIEQTNFIDVFGNVTPFYVSDAGDRIILQMELRSSIRMTSIGNPLTLDPSLNQVLSPSTNWITEGFRVLDWVLVRIHNSGGSLIAGPYGQFWSQISYVDDIMCDFGSMPDWYSLPNGEFITMYVVTGSGSTTLVARDDLDVLFNHVKNGNPGSEFSLIDAEVSRLQFQGVAALPVAGIANGILLGNQSGGFVASGTVERQFNDAEGWLHHRLRIEFINPGIYDDNWFFSSECLKIYSKLLWARISGEPFARAEAIYNLQANTGGFNEPNNSSLLNAVLVSGITELDYCVPTTFNIIVDGPLANIGLGAGYRSIDDNYYKNKLQSQFVFSMLIGTDLAANFFGGISSPQNLTGAGYDLEVNSVTVGGSITNISVTFTPNAAFSSFFDGVDDGDRLFYLWVKCGNLNLLAFEGQLTCDPPIGGPLIMVDDWGYLDHSENVTTASGVSTGYEADTEDDLAYFGTFRLDKLAIIESFSVKVEAFNIVTGEDFTLQIATFGFGGVQISGAGVYLLNETQTINSILPTTSVKRDALLQLEPTLDNALEYGVKIYAPLILNWKYWLQQLNASVDFYPTQNKNWQQYDNLANWILRTELTLIKDGLAYTHDNQILDLDYDSNADIISNIALVVDASNLTVNVIPVGSLMRIETKHQNLLGAWGVNTWGMITIESFESSPRFICSTVVPLDNNPANPLTPLSGLVMPIVFPAPDTAQFNCYFDPNIIDVSNGVKITSKIKDPDLPPVPYDYLIDAPKEAQIVYSVAYKVTAPVVYNGPAFRVRRDWDGLESDIPFFNVILDEVFLYNFVTNHGERTTANGFIVTLYDQSGFAVNGLTTLEIEQPPIVINGAINYGLNGIPAALCNGTTHGFTLSATVPALQTFASYFVFDRIAAGITSFTLSAAVTSPFVLLWSFIDRITDFMGTPANVWATDAATGNFLLTAFREPSNNMTVKKDGVAISTMSIPPSGGTFSLFLKRTTSAIFHDGNFQEFILFNNDQTANITAQETNIKNRYNIP